MIRVEKNRHNQSHVKKRGEGGKMVGVNVPSSRVSRAQFPR